MSEKIQLQELATRLPPNIDLFICSASFEARCLSVASVFIESQIDKALIFSDPDVSGPRGRENAQKLLALFRDRAQLVEIHLREPIDVADKMIRVLGDMGTLRTVVIDVTTFTHESLLILFCVIQMLHSRDLRLVGAYNGATEYSLGLDKREKWLTKGVLEIRSVLGFPGESRPTQSQHLIVLAGFELERAERIIDAYEPAMLSIGLGSALDSIGPNHHDVNKWFHEKLIERYAACVKKFVFAPDDLVRTREAILSQSHAYTGFNTLVAPMNTKISTMGAALAAVDDPSIQICYAVPEQYNREGYSFPSDDAYIFDIPLD